MIDILPLGKFASIIPTNTFIDRFGIMIESMSPTWVGPVADPGKIAFIKSVKRLDNVAVYLITFLESKWENRQIKNRNAWAW